MSFATNSAIAPAAPIAIVGIGCRLPGGVLDPASFWQLLVEGRQVIGEVPPDRWSLDAYFHPDRAATGAMASRWGGFLNTLKEFDAGFWGVSPREAQRMDPQQRWLLEVAWEAIEDAGTAPSRLRGAPVGVFIGISGNDYGSLQLGDIEQVDAYTNSGNTASIASNRISYMLDLRGPSVSLDTACSSSLVAVAMACDSLRTGACETALAGGVNALITPQVSVGFSKASMLSPSGRCYAFDARADGYVRAEGVGVVVLKPLDRALANRDRIYAVIRGTAVNQDGHTSSMTVPSVDGQSAMLAAAYANAGVVPASVAYVETHGTGTPLGDPIEATALGRVLGAGRAPDEACVIGSVKANIGHLESASGIAGLIKAALVAQHRLIPPSLNYERPNPQIPFESLRLVVANRARPLASPNDEPPIVGVNSFGFGGTNAHVVLQSPPQAQESAPVVDRADRPLVLPISARDETALRAYVSAFCRCLQNGTEPLADLCAAAGSRKEQHPHRLVVAGRTGSELEGQLRQWLRDGHAPGVVSGRTKSNRPPVFVFTGQGGQWWAMGRTLAAREPLVRRRLEETDRILRAFTGSSLIDELNRDEVSSQIDGTDIAQPALFALQVALVDLWRSWGITPAAVIGHSVGEVAAAYTAGIYSFDDAVPAHLSPQPSAAHHSWARADDCGRGFARTRRHAGPRGGRRRNRGHQQPAADHAVRRRRGPRDHRTPVDRRRRVLPLVADSLRVSLADDGSRARRAAGRPGGPGAATGHPAFRFNSRRRHPPGPVARRVLLVGQRAPAGALRGWHRRARAGRAQHVPGDRAASDARRRDHPLPGRPRNHGRSIPFAPPRRRRLGGSRSDAGGDAHPRDRRRLAVFQPGQSDVRRASPLSLDA